MSQCLCGCGQTPPIAPRTRKSRGWIMGEPRPLCPGHSPVRSPAGTNPPQRAGGTAEPTVPSRDWATLGKLAELLERQGIPVEEIGAVQRVNAWQGFYKDDDGEAQTVDMVGISLTPQWADGPQWPVVQPASPANVRHVAPKPRQGTGRVTVILPDPQIGFRRYSDGTLDPMHDEKAMTVALSIIEYLRPQRIVDLGDYLDLAEWSSKFAVLPEFVLTTQPAVDAGHRFLAEQQAAAGDSLEEHDLLEGNHDDRIPRLISQNAKAAMRLTRADQPEGWPVMSVPNLLALDSLPVPVRYVDGYPAGRIKLADAHGAQTALYALHGERLDMTKQSKAERQSTVQGHTHHVSVHTETYEVDGDPVEVGAWSLGCLCRVDGAVPSTRGGTDVRGRPVRRQESWQQAIGVLTETSEGWALEPVRIRDGHALFRGKNF